MHDEKTYTSVWQYLDELGILDTGTEEEIKKAKKDYRRIYQRQYKRRIRKNKKETTIRFSMEDVHLLKSTDLYQARSFARLVREAAVAYARKKYVIPNPILVGRIEQHLSLMQQSIKELAQRDTKNWFSDTKRYHHIERMLERFETELFNKLRTPLLLQDYIETLKRERPDYLDELKNLL